VFISILLILLMSLPIYAESIESIKLLKISPQDACAIIKNIDGKMQIIKMGDLIGNGKIVEITKGRVVIEEKTDSGPETVIIRLEDGKQRVERIKKGVDKQPLLLRPQ